MKQTLRLLGLLAAVITVLITAGVSGPSVSAQANSPLVGPRVVTVRSLPPAASAATPGLDIAVARRSIAVAQQPGATAEGSAPAGAETTAVDGTTPTLFDNNFDGIDNTDNGVVTGFTVTPPDPQLAAGPDHVAEFVNIIGRIHDKKGNEVSSFALADFFGVPSGYLDTDPKIIYDALSGRWFASYVSFADLPGQFVDPGRLHIAVSATDDPTGTWYLYYLEYGGTLPDYAAIGLTDDKVTLSSNVYDIDEKFMVPPCTSPFGFCGEQTVVIEKSQLMAGAASPAITVLPLDPNSFTVRPAHSLSSVSDQYLASFDLSADLPSTALTVTRISGAPALANVTRTVVASPTIQPHDSPPLSQTNGGGTIDSGDFRLLETVYRDGTLWAAAGTSCTPAGDTAARSCAHLMQVDTSSGALLQEMVYGNAGEYYSWPSVRTDPDGNLFVSLTHTNASIFAEAAATGRLASDPPNALSPIVVLQAGSVLHTSGRWGDYLGAAIDPVTPACIWLVGEYAKPASGADWGTTIGSVGYSGCDSDSDGWATPADNCPGVANSSQADADADSLGDACDNCPQWPNSAQNEPDWVTPVGDSDCDGYPDSVPGSPVTYRAGESVIGTVASAHCNATATVSDEPLANDAWPPDFNDNQLVNGADVLHYNLAFGHPTTDPPVNIGGTLIPLTRFDLNASGLINGSDVLQMNPFFSKRCDS